MFISYRKLLVFGAQGIRPMSYGVTLSTAISLCVSTNYYLAGLLSFEWQQSAIRESVGVEATAPTLAGITTIFLFFTFRGRADGPTPGEVGVGSHGTSTRTDRTQSVGGTIWCRSKA